MASADTNVLVRLLTGDEPEQTAAARRALGKGSLHVPLLALVESIWVLENKYRLLRPDLIELIEVLLTAAEFALERKAEVEDALAMFRKSKADFADCLLLAGARSAGQLPLLTFDRTLARLDGARLVQG